MLGIGLKLLGIRKWLSEAVGAAFRWLVRNPLPAVIIALCIALAWFWHLDHRHLAQRDAARAQVVAWKLANDKAIAWALAEKRAKETAATDIKDHANDSRQLAQAAGARAGDDYADSHKCVRASAGSRVNADLPRSNPLAGQPERAAQDVDLVAVGRPDFNTCTASVIDLNNALDWADALRAKGLAK